jgi:hypothetical protein
VKNVIVVRVVAVPVNTWGTSGIVVVANVSTW